MYTDYKKDFNDYLLLFRNNSLTWKEKEKNPICISTYIAHAVLMQLVEPTVACFSKAFIIRYLK